MIIGFSQREYSHVKRWMEKPKEQRVLIANSVLQLTYWAFSGLN